MRRQICIGCFIEHTQSETSVKFVFGKMSFNCPKHRRRLIYTKLCRKCGLPKNPLFTSHQNLSLFHSVDWKRFDNTGLNKANHRIDRMFTYCNNETCEKFISLKSQDFLDLMHSVLGPEPSKNAIKKWKRDPNYRPEVRV